jgi:hypothetical protein
MNIHAVRASFIALDLAQAAGMASVVRVYIGIVSPTQGSATSTCLISSMSASEYAATAC